MKQDSTEKILQKRDAKKSFRLPKKLNEELNKVAKEKGLTASDIVIMALNESIGRR
jgi:predicted DNA-binding protein